MTYPQTFFLRVSYIRERRERKGDNKCNTFQRSKLQQTLPQYSKRFFVLTIVSTYVILELNLKKPGPMKKTETRGSCWKSSCFLHLKWNPASIGNMDTDHSRNQDFALTCKHMGKESSFIVSTGFLVSYVLVLDDTIINMGWAYILSILLHWSVQCLLYYALGLIIT